MKIEWGGDRSDPEWPTPPDRVAHMEATLKAYWEDNGSPRQDPDTCLTDVLADLMHWAEARGVAWDKVEARARGHYDEERGINRTACHIGDYNPCTVRDCKRFHIMRPLP